jgi:hypothetical protein
MAKHRTLKQKREAKHSFTLKWNPSSTKLEFEPNVNRQIPEESNSFFNEAKTYKTTQISAKSLNLENIKKNILKSLILAGLILTSELVLYLIRK